MKSGPLAVFLAVAALACAKHGSGSPPDGGAAGADTTPGAPDAPFAAAPDAGLAIDASDAAFTGDTGLLSPPELGYVQFVAAYNAGYRRRLVGCFNFDPRTLAQTNYRDTSSEIMASLRLGFAGWNAAEATRCLEALATAVCEDIASNKGLGACGLVITGRVPDDGACIGDHDCSERGRVCGAGAQGCGGLCQRNLVAPVPGGDGAPCTQPEDCAPGLFCQARFGHDEVCRPIVPGLPCEMTMECPFPYACVADAAGKGACGPGRASGQRCREWEPVPGQGRDSECALTGTCVANAAGGTCVGDPPWSSPIEPAPVPPGAPCVSNDEARCILGSFCRFDPADLVREPPPPRLTGVCLLWRKPGDFCEQGDACQPGSTCVGTTCVSCGAGTPSDAGAPDASPGGADAGCKANLMSDPNNCGACGHGCQGAACFQGFCRPRAIGAGQFDQIEAMVLDDSGVYLTEHTMLGRVLRVTTDGSAPIKVLASRQNLPAGIAVDATHVYWANWTTGTGGSVSRVPKAGGTIEILAADELGPQQVAVDATHVYWGNHADGVKQGIRRMPKLGGAVEMLSAGGSPTGLALDDTHVYWAEWATATVNRRAKAGGLIEVLARDERDINRLVIDATRVYWVGADHIASVAKGGGPVSVLVPTFAVYDLATDGAGGVWWSTNTEIERWPQPPTRIVNDAIGLHEIEVRGPWLYYVAGGSLLRVAR
jgi:hypothetical protein